MIASLRTKSNAALESHDIAAFAAMMEPDYVVLPGSHGRPIGIDALLAALSRDFAGGELMSITRTPAFIEIGDSGARAAEQGNWTTIWNKAGGQMRLGGVYQATWVARDGGWKLLNESFVTLSCSGSSACATAG